MLFNACRISVIIFYKMKKRSEGVKKSRVYSKKMIKRDSTEEDSKPVKEVDPNLMSRLKNIIEVTEEEGTPRLTDTEPEGQSSDLIAKIQNKEGLIQRSLRCLKEIVQCFDKKNQFTITVKDELFVEKIEQLRAHGVKSQPLLPPLSFNKKTIVLDLDHTLINPSLTKPAKYDFSFQLPFSNAIHTIYCQNRFGIDSFLFEISKLYEIVLYSSGTKAYVDSILQQIDIKGRIKHRIYRDKCIRVNKVYYLKSLKILGRNENSVIFIDNNPASGVLQPNNFLQVKPFRGENHDRQLVKLIPFLREMEQKNSVLPVSKKYEEYRNIEIMLKFGSLDGPIEEEQFSQTTEETHPDMEYFDKENIPHHSKTPPSRLDIVEEKKAKYHHTRANSEVQSLTEKKEEQQDGKPQSATNEHEESTTPCMLKPRDLNMC